MGRCRAFLTLLTLFLLTPFAQGAEPLRVVLFDVPPYASVNAAGSLEGVYVDLSRALAARAGLSVKIELAPFARIPHLLKLGEADISFAFLTQELAQSSIVLGKVGKAESILLPRKGWAPTDFTDVNNKTLGRLRGGCMDIANNRALQPNFYELASVQTGLRMLKNGRLDGLCSTRLAVIAAAEQLQLPLSSLGTPNRVSQRDILLFASEKTPVAIQAQLISALKTMEQDKSLQAIWLRYETRQGDTTVLPPAQPLLNNAAQSPAQSAPTPAPKNPRQGVPHG